MVLGPAIDGGYTLIGLSRPHARVFEDIPWSTPDVYRLTVERAAEIGVPVVTVPLWYDVDDRADLAPPRSRARRPEPLVCRGRIERCAGAGHAAVPRAAPCLARRGDVVVTRSLVLYSSPGRDGLAPLLALGALGLAMLAFVAAGPWIIARYDFAVFIPSVVASGALTIAATMLAPSVPTRAGLILILGFAVIMRLLVITDDPFLSTDIYRYVWDGRVQAAGINPYALVPADPALAALRDAAIYPNINRADYAVTAYPPVAQAFFLAVTRISETLVMMRLAMVACEAVIVVVMIDLLRQLRLPATAVVAWAWHPAGDLGDRAGRACRRADGGAADAGRLAAGAPARHRRRVFW